MLECPYRTVAQLLFPFLVRGDVLVGPYRDAVLRLVHSHIAPFLHHPGVAAHFSGFHPEDLAAAAGRLYGSCFCFYGHHLVHDDGDGTTWRILTRHWRLFLSQRDSMVLRTWATAGSS